MSNYYESNSVYKPIYLPCGGVAEFDDGSGCSHRCIDCGATVGSIGMPRSCTDEAKKWEAWQAIGGKGWDYGTGSITNNQTG